MQDERVWLRGQVGGCGAQEEGGYDAAVRDYGWGL